MSRPVTDATLYPALVTAGLVREGDLVRRVVIDIEAGKAVTVYVERTGDERLLEVLPVLAGIEVVHGTPREGQGDAQAE